VILVAAVYEYQELNLNEERQTHMRVYTAHSDENDYEPISIDVTTSAEVYCYVDVPRTPATYTGSPLGRISTECFDKHSMYTI